MALQRYEVDYRRLTADEISAWKKIPPPVATDCMNRTQSMQAGIKPVVEGQLLCGQARTIQVMAGDCLAICEAIATVEPGEILVVDAGGVEDTAVWGGVMTFDAVQRKIGGVVIDGAVRDIADIRRSGLAVFCRGAVARGPHHGYGGTMDSCISVAGAVVASGDIVLGNDDGVVVVPLARADEVLAAAQAHLIKEEVWMSELRAGKTIKELFEFPDSTVIS